MIWADDSPCQHCHPDGLEWEGRIMDVGWTENSFCELGDPLNLPFGSKENSAMEKKKILKIVQDVILPKETNILSDLIKNSGGVLHLQV